MPTYTYLCPTCGEKRDVIHPMDEVTTGPTRPATIETTTCAAAHAPAQMTRVFHGSAPFVGTGTTGAGLQARKKMVRQRSSAHFEKEIKERKQAIMKEPLRQQ